MDTETFRKISLPLEALEDVTVRSRFQKAKLIFGFDVRSNKERLLWGDGKSVGIPLEEVLVIRFHNDQSHEQLVDAVIVLKNPPSPLEVPPLKQ